MELLSIAPFVISVNFFAPNDRLVMNNTRVMPARLFGQKETGGKIELLLLREEKPFRWRVLMKSSRRPTIGSQLTFCEGQLIATIIADGDQGEALLQFESEQPILELLERYGLPPLPPYIQRATPDEYAADRERYQTVYASQPGAAAAPTAGLHFTPELIELATRIKALKEASLLSMSDWEPFARSLPRKLQIITCMPKNTK